MLKSMHRLPWPGHCLWSPPIKLSQASTLVREEDAQRWPKAEALL